MLLAAPAMIHYTQDGLSKSSYTVLSFTNKSMDRSVSGVISKKPFDGISLNLRATDLTKEQVAAIFKALKVPPPPL